MLQANGRRKKAKQSEINGAVDQSAEGNGSLGLRTASCPNGKLPPVSFRIAGFVRPEGCLVAYQWNYYPYPWVCGVFIFSQEDGFVISMSRPCSATRDLSSVLELLHDQYFNNLTGRGESNIGENLNLGPFLEQEFLSRSHSIILTANLFFSFFFFIYQFPTLALKSLVRRE
ncbi:hypothetical protein BDV41DRAFT_550445 [Aspergillus transmontanensis]|uniref:Uncharacterized protein n=1 Tax=Aspergillus transmontanensis TaxID=1034304 RepID=A0A5N6VKV4_9EURO|nr:hypothetical protein BDV41DRAFT_550445 [Aspergillus transmontanensis]